MNQKRLVIISCKLCHSYMLLGFSEGTWYLSCHSGFCNYQVTLKEAELALSTLQHREETELSLPPEELED